MASVDIQLQNQAKSTQVFRPIKFVPAKTNAARFTPGHTRFKPINPLRDDLSNGADSDGDEQPEKPATRSVKKQDGSAGDASTKSNESETSKNSIPTNWENIVPVGTGLQNLGNTCYLNSALQCLLHTPPLANLFLFHSDKFPHECPSKKGQHKFCFMCELRNQFIASFRGPFGSDGSKSSPSRAATQGRSGLRAIVYSGLPLLGKHFKVGRQMDSHEFLMLLLEHLEKESFGHRSIRSAFEGLDVPPRPSDPDPNTKPPKPTSMVFATFGGYLQSQIRCLQCPYESNTYDPCSFCFYHTNDFVCFLTGCDTCLDMGLNLELTKATTTLEQALKHFTEPEVLEKDNAYKCPKCKKPVPARKQFTIYRTPPVLYIQLKRFTWSGAKIHRNVKYPLELDISPYATENNVLSAEQARELLKSQDKLSKAKRTELLRGSGRLRKSCQYELYGVLVHIGGGCRSGHYICYVKSAGGIWHRMDDSHVQKVSVADVLGQSDAYLLFYRRKQSASTPPASPMKPTATPVSPAPASVADSDTPETSTSDDSTSEDSTSDDEPATKPSQPAVKSPPKPVKSSPVPIKPVPVPNVSTSSKAKKGTTAAPNAKPKQPNGSPSEIAAMLISANPSEKTLDADVQELEDILDWGKSKSKKVDVVAAGKKKRKREEEEKEPPKIVPAAKKQKPNETVPAKATPAIAVPALKPKLSQLFGLSKKVGSWKEDEEAAEVHTATARAAILAAEATAEAETARGIKKRQRDDWDKEYDQGKLPKRRKKDSDEEAADPSAPNKFQTTAEKLQKKKQQELERGVKSKPKGGFGSPANKFKKKFKPQIKERRGWKNL